MAVIAIGFAMNAASTWLRPEVPHFRLQNAVLIFTVAWLVTERHAIARGTRRFVERGRQARVPMPVKALVLLVGAAQLVHLSLGVTNYPFADVGMFRWAEPNRPLNPVLGRQKYYFRDARGQVRLVDIRRQHLELPRDLLGWGWTNEITYTTTFHFQDRERTYEYLRHALASETGAAQLQVGLQTVDFRDGRIEFITDPARVAKHPLSHRPLWNPDTDRTHHGR